MTEPGPVPPRPVGGQPFDSGHTGLDHVSFAVDSRDELDKAVAALDGAGIQHGDIIDMADAGVAILSFQDPDDINIELTAPVGRARPVANALDGGLTAQGFRGVMSRH